MPRLIHPLTLVLAIHIGLGLTFGLVTPIFEAPDEANHFLFIRYLQIHHTLPVQTPDADGPRAHHPPLYFLLGALVSAWVPNAGSADRIQLQDNASLWFRYGDQSNDHKAKFMHTPQERWPFRGQALAVHVIRPLSTLFSALAVFFTYLAARQLLPRQRAVALLAAALLAFNPMVVFMSGVVQNSTAALAASAALLYVFSRWLRQGFSLTRWGWIGVLFSVAVLIQTSGLALAAPTALGLAYDAGGRGGPAPTPRARRLQRLIASALAFGLPVVLLTGWWFVRNQILYGDWTANSIVGALWADQPTMPFEQVWHLLATGMVGRFGFGLIVEYPDAIYRVVWLLALVAALGLVRLALPVLAQPSSFRLNDEAMLWTAHLATVVAVSLALGAYILWYIHGAHGRYMFTAFPSIALLLAAGGLAWFRPAWRAVVANAGVTLTLGLALYGLSGLLIPTYAMPRSPTQAEQRQMTPLEADIGGKARLLGYKMSRTSVKPGEDLVVTVYWLPLSQTDTPYTVFVHLFEPGVGSVAQRDTYPGLGNYATTVWDSGRVFVDTYRLHLPADAPALDDAKILLGLYDEATMQRLPVTGADAGSPEEAWVQFGDIQVMP